MPTQPSDPSVLGDDDRQRCRSCPCAPAAPCRPACSWWAPDVCGACGERAVVARLELRDPELDYAPLDRREPFDFTQVAPWLAACAGRHLEFVLAIAAVGPTDLDRAAPLMRRQDAHEDRFRHDALWLIGYVAGATRAADASDVVGAAPAIADGFTAGAGGGVASLVEASRHLAASLAEATP